jgi:ribosomal protein S18 acetylase RimI-like enzyme
MIDSPIITQTTDPDKIAICADMMARTDPWVRMGLSLDFCLPAFEGFFREVYVLELDQKIEGFAILQVTGSFKGYIQTLCVEESMRNKGLGKKLLEFAEARIHRISPNLFICVSTFNTRALKLYEDFGFTRVGILNNFLKEGFDEILLRKTTGPILNHLPIE